MESQSSEHKELALDILYDLQGRKVAAPQRGGLYIINGKKVVMK